MPFVIDRGFADVQIMKTLNWPYLLNRMEYFDESSNTYLYWHDLALEISNKYLICFLCFYYGA